MRKGLAWATVLLALPSLAEGQGQKMPPLPPATAPATSADACRECADENFAG